MEATKNQHSERQYSELGPDQDLSDLGASMVEYALIAALIAVVCLSAITFMGRSVSQKFSTVGSSFNNNN